MSHKEIPGLEERELPEFNAMQRVKRRFFAMRNGALAAQMDRGGKRYRINFGLNLPQLSDIARDFKPGGVDADGLPDGLDMAAFARRLRDNVSTRESMLIAPMLFPVEMLTLEEGAAWLTPEATPEVADVLCLKLLRNFAEADKLVDLLACSGEDLKRYCGLRLMLNLLQCGKFTADKALLLTEREEARACALTSPLCRQIREEIEFLMTES